MGDILHLTRKKLLKMVLNVPAVSTLREIKRTHITVPSYTQCAYYIRDLLLNTRFVV